MEVAKHQWDREHPTRGPSAHKKGAFGQYSGFSECDTSDRNRQPLDVGHDKREGTFPWWEEEWGPLGQDGHSPHVRKELLEPLLPMHRPELEPGRGVACVAQAVVEGPVLIECQAEAGPSQGGRGWAVTRGHPSPTQPVIPWGTWGSLTSLASFDP